MSSKRELVVNGIYTTGDGGQALVTNMDQHVVTYRTRATARGRWSKEEQTISRQKWWNSLVKGDAPIKVAKAA